MTLDEFGLKLRSEFPALNQLTLSNREVAQHVLEIYPDLATPFAEAYTEVLNRDPEVRRGLIFRRRDVEAEATASQTRTNDIRNIHAVEVALFASAEGLSVEVWQQKKLAEVQHEHKIVEMRESTRLKIYESMMERDIGLDGDQRIRLRHVWEAAELRQRLKELHDERHEVETGSKPDAVKVELLADIDAEVTRLRAVLNGLEGVVQDSAGQGLLSAEDPDRDSGRSEGAEEHQV